MLPEPVGLLDESVVAHMLGGADLATRAAPSPPFCVLVGAHDVAERAAVRSALEADGRFSKCSEAGDAPGALSLALRRHPHLCLLDVSLPGGSLNAAREVAARMPSTKIVFRTQTYERAELVACLQAGGAGYLSKSENSGRLPEVLVRVLGGEVAVPRTLVAWLVDGLRGGTTLRRTVAPGAGEQLTSREWEIFDLLCNRRSTAEIAEALTLSKATVRSHAASVAHKLGVRDRGELVERYARQ